MSYKLTNGEERARSHPSTFEIPSLSRRRGLSKGDFAKLIFDESERMWVKVTSREEKDGKVFYKGVLDNKPVVVRNLELGDPVEFGPEHIIQAETPS